MQNYELAATKRERLVQFWMLSPAKAHTHNKKIIF
jgi:hypothetical protein